MVVIQGVKLIQLNPSNSNCQSKLKLIIFELSGFQVIGVMNKKDHKHLIKKVFSLCIFYGKISSNVRA